MSQLGNWSYQTRGTSAILPLTNSCALQQKQDTYAATHYAKVMLEAVLGVNSDVFKEHVVGFLKILCSQPR